MLRCWNRGDKKGACTTSCFWAKPVLFATLLLLPRSVCIAQIPQASQPAADARAHLDQFSIRVEVTTWKGKVVAGVKVRLSGQSSEIVGLTDANGHYTFDNLSPGEYSILAERADGYTSNHVKRKFGPGSWAVLLSFPEIPSCPYRDGESTVKCLDAAIKQFVGGDAVDCGKGYIYVSSVVKPITKCVHKNLKRHLPFVARYEVPTTDSYHVDAFVGDSSGHVHALMYDSNGIWDFADPVYVLVDDCSNAKTDLFSMKWVPVPCKQKGE